uniref:Uncharacterized protein n=1 Tax=Siphoviridae sp. ctYBm1 TaxID=2826374 RepID=A0A8S5LS16_9CAUD|nr:MAG TPA: hypothetical protein [Siphoviridae sp. ctYBm1]
MKYNDTIQHFGIKGMKWGHRNRREHLMNKYLSKGYDMNSAASKTEKRLKIEKAAKTAAIVGGAALGTYLGYKGYKGVSRYLDQKRLQKAAEQLNKIRKTNEQIKSGKNSKIKGFGGKIKDVVKEAHRKDTERFTKQMDEAIIKKAAKQASKSNADFYADNILKIAQQKPGILGRRKPESIADTKRKISTIADNFAKAKRQMNSTGKTIDSIDTQALENVKKLMQKR